MVKEKKALVQKSKRKGWGMERKGELQEKGGKGESLNALIQESLRKGWGLGRKGELQEQWRKGESLSALILESLRKGELLVQGKIGRALSSVRS